MSEQEQDETSGFVVESGPQAAPQAAQVEDEAAEAVEAEEPEQKAEREETPEWVRRRLARAARKQSEAVRERDEFAEKYQTAKAMIDKLARQKNGGLDPNDFESVKDYQEAKRAIEDGSKKLSAPPAMSADLREALGDLREEVDAADEGLWAKLGEIPAEEAFLAEPMILSLADLEEAAPAALRAWLDLKPEEREAIADMTSRRRRRALTDLAAKAPKGKAAKAEAETRTDPPARDANGQFAKRQSDAPPPIDPVRGSSTGDVPLEKASFAEFEARRNEQERGRSGSRW